MKDLLNCPNCGAPITGSKCEYCGTIFEKSVNLDLELDRLTREIKEAQFYVSQSAQTSYLLSALSKWT